MTPPPWGRVLPGNGWDALADLEPADLEPADPGLAGLDAKWRTVSVVVTHFDQPEQLARTLAALTRQTLRPDEVVVADDGSREAPRVPPGVRLVRQEDRGFRAAAARHLGATYTTGEVLVFLDADTTPEPDLVEVLTRLPRHQPDLLAVGRRRHATLAGTPVEAPVAEIGPAHELPEPAWLSTAYAASRDLLDADDLSCRFVISAVLACSRWWYDEVGGFDPSFEAYGGEDWELAHRSWLAGGLVAHVPAAVAWHDGPDAGASPRGVATVETAAIAGRIGAPGLAPHGLLAIGGRTVPVDRVLAPSASLEDRELLLVVDAALRADPGARLSLDERQAAVVGPDPRVLVRTGAPLEALLPTGARVLVELHRAWQLDDDGWRALLRGGGPGGGLGGGLGGEALEHVADGAPVATSTALRLVRRARRWGADPAPRSSVPAAGRPLPADLTLEAWFGGWSDYRGG